MRYRLHGALQTLSRLQDHGVQFSSELQDSSYVESTGVSSTHSSSRLEMFFKRTGDRKKDTRTEKKKEEGY